MRVLWPIYSYAVCTCALYSTLYFCYLLYVFCSLLRSGYLFYVFVICFMFVFSFCMFLLSILSGHVFFAFFFVLFPTCVQVYWPQPPGGNPTALNKTSCNIYINTVYKMVFKLETNQAKFHNRKQIYQGHRCRNPGNLVIRPLNFVQWSPIFVGHHWRTCFLSLEFWSSNIFGTTVHVKLCETKWDETQATRV